MMGAGRERVRVLAGVLWHVRAWRPARQPVSHPKKHRSFLGDPGLETGATTRALTRVRGLADERAAWDRRKAIRFNVKCGKRGPPGQLLGS